jgi:hypothetical protein
MATDSVLRSRLLSKIEIDKETGCWNWTAGKTAGYGSIRILRDGVHTKHVHYLAQL